MLENDSSLMRQIARELARHINSTQKNHRNIVIAFERSDFKNALSEYAISDIASELKEHVNAATACHTELVCFSREIYHGVYLNNLTPNELKKLTRQTRVNAVERVPDINCLLKYANGHNRIASAPCDRLFIFGENWLDLELNPEHASLFKDIQEFGVLPYIYGQSLQVPSFKKPSGDLAIISKYTNMLPGYEKFCDGHVIVFSKLKNIAGGQPIEFGCFCDEEIKANNKTADSEQMGIYVIVFVNAEAVSSRDGVVARLISNIDNNTLMTESEAICVFCDALPNRHFSDAFLLDINTRKIIRIATRKTEILKGD